MTASGDTNGGRFVPSEADSAAKSIILAMKQEVGWSDVIRAAFGSKPIVDRERMYYDQLYQPRPEAEC